MKILIKYLFFCSCFFALFVACRKYPQGGRLHKANEYLSTDWELTSYKIDNWDSTGFVKKKISGSYNYTADIFFIGDGTDNNKFTCNPNFSKYNYDVEFSSNKKYLKFTPTEQTLLNVLISPSGFQIFNPLNLDATITWQIMKLTGTELTLRYFNDYYYELKLKKR